VEVVKAKFFHVVVRLTGVLLEFFLMPSNVFTGTRCFFFHASCNWKLQFYGQNLGDS